MLPYTYGWKKNRTHAHFNLPFNSTFQSLNFAFALYPRAIFLGVKPAIQGRQKFDYDVETRTKNRGFKALKNWACGQGNYDFKKYKLTGKFVLKCGLERIFPMYTFPYILSPISPVMWTDAAFSSGTLTWKKQIINKKKRSILNNEIE